MGFPGCSPCKTMTSTKGPTSPNGQRTECRLDCVLRVLVCVCVCPKTQLGFPRAGQSLISRELFDTMGSCVCLCFSSSSFSFREAPQMGGLSCWLTSKNQAPKMGCPCTRGCGLREAPKNECEWVVLLVSPSAPTKGFVPNGVLRRAMGPSTGPSACSLASWRWQAVGSKIASFPLPRPRVGPFVGGKNIRTLEIGRNESEGGGKNAATFDVRWLVSC